MYGGAPVAADAVTDRPGWPGWDRPGGPADSPVEREDPALLLVLHRYLAAGEAFLDVGANVGLFSIDVALHLGPRGLVYAFEPAPDAVRELEKNARRSGVRDRIQIFSSALGSRTQHRALRADPRYPHDWTKRSLFSVGPVVEEVAVRAFDDLVRTGEITLPKGLEAVKIDVEGAEAEVIRGMSNTLRELRPRIIVVETIPDHQDRAGSSVDEIGTLLAEVGYSPPPSGAQTPYFVYNTIYVPAEQSEVAGRGLRDRRYGSAMLRLEGAEPERVGVYV